MVILAWNAITTKVNQLGQVEGRSWLFLLASGLATGLSWLCYFRALQLGSVAQVAPVDKLSVVFAIVLATLFLGEHFTLRQALGAALIVGGVLVFALERPAASRPKEAILQSAQK